MLFNHFFKLLPYTKLAINVCFNLSLMGIWENFALKISTYDSEYIHSIGFESFKEPYASFYPLCEVHTYLQRGLLSLFWMWLNPFPFAMFAYDLWVTDSCLALLMNLVNSFIQCVSFRNCMSMIYYMHYWISLLEALSISHYSKCSSLCLYFDVCSVWMYIPIWLEYWSWWFYAAWFTSKH